jgi:hypothetical protein
MAKRRPAQRRTLSRRPRAARAKPPAAPKRRNCGSLMAHFALLDRFPDARRNQGLIEVFTRQARAGERTTRQGVVRVPVVVHVVLKDPTRVTNAQIHAQIARLNLDYRAQNPDLHEAPAPFQSLAADAQIEFHLATKKPNGKPTTGIQRKRTTKASFSLVREDVKDATQGGVAPWDPSRYLNVWVCALESDVLGYGQFPGGDPATDGVVILYTAFGSGGSAQAPFDLGRTLTHEAGHYFNLSHIWGESRIPTCDDDDFVSDTPPQKDKNFGKPTFPHVSCQNAAPNGDLFMNYMDYVDDDSMFLFTHGQVARMRATLSGPRGQLGT